MKRIIPFLLIFCSVWSVWAVEIKEQELEKTADTVIEFFNYVGPHEKIETDEEIRNIGAGLSRSLPDGVEGSKVRRADFADKYRIVHIIAPAELAGLNADIFIILEDAQVDHIDNIRRILSGYVTDAYNIPKARADALAVFITYYNAVYRGDAQYIQDTYNEYVFRELDPEKIGIARRYNEWPGSTQILIPLTELEGVTTPAAETLGGDEKVVEELRQQEDRGIEERKEIVEMREDQLEKEQDQLEEEKAALEEKQAELEEMKESPQTEPEEIAEKEQEVLEEEAKIAEKEEVLAERKDQIDREREQVSEDQKEIIAREEAEREAVEEREAEQAAPAATAAPARELSPFILVEERGNTPFGTIVLIDSAGEVQKRSRLNTVRSRDIILQRDQLYAVAGEDNPPRTVRLVSLDTDSLELTGESETDVFSDTVVKLVDGSFFCVVKVSGDYYLGRFNTDLEMESRSAVKVARYTYLYPADSRITVQRYDGQVVFLDRNSLEEVE